MEKPGASWGIRNRLRLSDDNVLIIFAGKIIPGKKIELLLNALNILNDKKTHYITFSQKFEVTKFKNYVGNISSADSIEKNLTDMQQKKIDICYDCIFTKECAGIWTEYLRLFGNKEIRELAVKHGCVKRNTEFY